MNSDIRIGLVGADTSHVTAFTKLLNDTSDPAYIPGAKVVACYPSFSDDWDKSYTRIEGFRSELQGKYAVAMVESIEALMGQVDAVLLESVDGRRHLDELRRIIAAKPCPVYIDKPLAASLADAKAIIRLLKEHDIPAWSSSSLRYEANLDKFLAGEHGTITGADTYGPCALEPTQPGLYWYGIHAVEELYRILGPGCRKVQCVSSEQADVVTGEWSDGRIGVMRGNRTGKGEFGAVVYCEDDVYCVPRDKQAALYRPLLEQIVGFLETKVAPVPLEETLEIMAFIEAANDSATAGGKAVELDTSLD